MTKAIFIIRARTMLVFALASLVLFGAVAMAAEESRVSVTTQGLKAAVDAGQGKTSHHEFDSNATIGKRSEKGKSSANAKTSEQGSATPNTDFWFYTADVELFSDRDRDGYFYGIDLLFDADTIYSVADVYAVVYLSRDGAAWEEYAVTEDFTLLGASSEDEYVIVTELVSGYPAGSYDILIELFDAWDGTFVADIGPADTSELAFLPLEDSERDSPAPGGSTIVVNNGGGGAATWMLLMLGSLLALRGRRQA